MRNKFEWESACTKNAGGNKRCRIYRKKHWNSGANIKESGTSGIRTNNGNTCGDTGSVKQIKQMRRGWNRQIQTPQTRPQHNGRHSVMVWENLFKGKRNAIKGSDLAKMLGLELRNMTNIIEQERREGRLICANCGEGERGYYLAETMSELLDYLTIYKGRGLDIFRTSATMMKAARETLQDTLPIEPIKKDGENGE